MLSRREASRAKRKTRSSPSFLALCASGFAGRSFAAAQHDGWWERAGTQDYRNALKRIKTYRKRAADFSAARFLRAIIAKNRDFTEASISRIGEDAVRGDSSRAHRGARHRNDAGESTMFCRRRRFLSAQLPVKDGALLYAAGQDRTHTSHLIVRAALETIRI